MDSHDVRPKVPGIRSHKYFSPAALGTVASKQGGVTARIDTRDRLTRQMWLSTLKLLDIVAKELKVIPAYAAVALIVIYAAPSTHCLILCCNIDPPRTNHHIPLQLIYLKASSSICCEDVTKPQYNWAVTEIFYRELCYFSPKSEAFTE